MNVKLDNALLQGRAILEDVGLPYFLVGGTLLGIVREGSLLEHDKDVDVGCLTEDLTPPIKRKLKRYRQFKVESHCISKNGELVFEFDAIHFDIFPMTRIGDKRFFNQRGSLGLWWPANIIEAHGIITYRDIVWNTPSPAEKFLDQMYGNWHIVDKNFLWSADSLNYTTDIRKV